MKHSINGRASQGLVPMTVAKTGKFIREYLRKMREFSMMKGHLLSIFYKNMGKNSLTALTLITPFFVSLISF